VSFSHGWNPLARAKLVLFFDGAVDVDPDPERVIHTRKPHGLIHPSILRPTTNHGPQIQQPPVQHIHLPRPLHLNRVLRVPRITPRTGPGITWEQGKPGRPHLPAVDPAFPVDRRTE